MTDSARTRFVKDHFQKDPTESHHYDLVLNSSRFSVSECADLIIEALRRLQGRGEPAGAKTLQGNQSQGATQPAPL